MSNTPSLSQIKTELQSLPAPELVALLLRTAKYKVENKELLHYLLFEAGNEDAFIAKIQDEIREQMRQVNTSNLYFAKKGIRKILRFANKHIRYSSLPSTQIEILLCFLEELKKLPIRIEQSQVLTNLSLAQMKRIRKELAKLHEDLQYDFEKRLERI